MALQTPVRMAGSQIRVNRKAADRVASGHPWIFASDVSNNGGAEPGAAVLVLDPAGRSLGMAHYSQASQIAIRMLTDEPRPIDRQFFLDRLAAAEQFRRRIFSRTNISNTNAYRVVHAEGDLLPALIVDRYADYLVVQTLNQGMDRARDLVLSCLTELFSPRGIVLRNDAPVRTRENLPLEKGVAVGEVPDDVAVALGGLRLHADLLHGQKTGIFLDQRENYLAAALYARGQALDCFTSTGGFALHLASRCDHVEAIESSAAALHTARRNAADNSITNVTFREADVFDLLAGYSSSRRQFDLVVLDPPAFAKSRHNLEAAIRGYKEINLRALRLLQPGGILVTCSCSHHLSEAALLEIVAEASLDARRKVRVLERRTQAQDHPILLTVPETHYLKCLILEVI